MSKKLVNSDFKNKRVEDPTRISSRQEKQVKKYVIGYFDKAVSKKKEHDKKKEERKSTGGSSKESPNANMEVAVKKEEESDEGIEVSDDEDVRDEQKTITPITPLDQIVNGDGLKRKRELDEGADGIELEGLEATPSKRARSITPPMSPPPPPPAEVTLEYNAAMEGLSPDDGAVAYGTSTPVSFDVTEVVNGEQTDIIEQPPTPPPPPPPISLSAKVSSSSCSSPVKGLNLQFYNVPTLGGDFGESMLDEQDEGLHNRNRSQSRLLEAQQGI